MSEKFDGIAQEIAKLAQCKSRADLRIQEAIVKKTIYDEHRL